MKFFSDIRLLLLGIWLGVACFFIAVAQAAFSILPERELAGAIVSRTLSVLNYAGLVIVVVLVVMSFVGSLGVNRFWLWTERLLLALIGISCAVNQFVIGFWLLSTRVQMGRPIDEVAADDVLRIQFNTLHQYSEWLLEVGMVAALLAFFVISKRKFSRARAGEDSKSDIYDFSKDFKI